MVRVKFTARDEARLRAKSEAIATIRDWARSSRGDARRCRGAGGTTALDAPYHSALARSFSFAAACLAADLRNERNKLILKKLRRR